MKTDMKFFMISLLLIGINIPTIYAQEKKTIMDLLIRHNWKTEFHLNGGVNITSTWIFTKNERIEKAKFQNKESDNIFKYYLSNEPDTTFNHDKVGKIFNGRYIILINKFSNVTAYEVAKITDTELEVYLLSKKSPSRKEQDKIKYQAIPK